MILQRLATSIRKQDWFTVLIETLIVVLGVFLGIQLGNWNEARVAEARKTEIIAALVTDLEDSIRVQEQKQLLAVAQGLAAWQAARARGEHPVPYYFRIEGSDTAPDSWSVLQKMDIAGLFDPVMIFDLTYYYSEVEGVGRKYIRYVTFVEDEILPFETGDPLYFYTPDGSALKPRFRANMDRLREWRGEVKGLALWASCLKVRLEEERRSSANCLREDPGIRNESLLFQPFSDEAAP